MISFVILIIFFNSVVWSNNCKRTDRYCYCDNECILYGDCCQGHVNFSKTGVLKNLLTCKKYTLFLQIWIIDKCPDMNHNLADFCSKNKTIPQNRLKSIIPVLTDDDKIYENAFCALCNNEKNFQYINISVKCLLQQPKNFQEINYFINNRRLCHFRPEYSPRLRLCNNEVIRKCPTDYKYNQSYPKDVIDFCENEISETFEDVTDGHIVFRNKNCCECWNKQCFPNNVSDHDTLLEGFTYLLNFNEWDEATRLKLDSNDSSNTNKNTSSVTYTDNIIIYISFYLILLSIISLVVLIIIYSFHAIFHNFGGYLTICLSSSLLVMNVFALLLTNKKISTSNFCGFFGIIQHYVALCNFIWMSIYSLDLLKTFGIGNGNSNKMKSFRTFLFYCLFAYGFAALIVGSATITEYNLNINSTIRPKYGGTNCWFSSKLGGVIWYFVPVCCLVTWNCIACVVVFYKLSKTAKECRIIQQKESNNTLWLCVRLTAVFGIGYFVQIIAVLSGDKICINIGSILNCLQGFFLTICFVWTKRVRTVITSSFSSLTGTKSNNSNVVTQKQSTKITRLSKDI